MMNLSIGALFAFVTAMLVALTGMGKLILDVVQWRRNFKKKKPSAYFGVSMTP
ncbi:hypothetical protein CGMCC3_g8661 [Colletotrichum fructicola]|nr:uncharacterized protein CGMCC3_g8661 [Colletotrichum fructicola]KAE9575433.1 hypothetical protein CGMCC3_g8661 [Colletotrichum fructicola]